MDITDDRLKTFIDLYKTEFGVNMTESDAKAEFTKLCQLYHLIYLSLPHPQLPVPKTLSQINYPKQPSWYTMSATHRIIN